MLIHPLLMATPVLLGKKEIGNFDPLGLSKDLDLTEMKRYREAEVTHGRVAMTAVLGFLVAESFHSLFGGNIGGPAIYHLVSIIMHISIWHSSSDLF